MSPERESYQAACSVPAASTPSATIHWPPRSTSLIRTGADHEAPRSSDQLTTTSHPHCSSQSGHATKTRPRGLTVEAYFAHGMTEDLLARLSTVRDLRIVARSALRDLHRSGKSPEEIGAELGVGALLQGSVRRAGDRVRIAAQLVDAGSGEYLWAETYDRQLTDLFAIQSEIAEKIATALGARLTSGERERIRRRPAASVSAYDYFIQARELYNQSVGSSGAREPLEKALALGERALALDPHYGPALASYALSKRAWGQLLRCPRQLRRLGHRPRRASDARHPGRGLRIQRRRSALLEPGLAAEVCRGVSQSL